MRFNANRLKAGVGTFVKGMYLFDDKLIDKILRYMFVDSPELVSEVNFSNEDILFINKVITFLSTYTGTDITNDFYTYFKVNNARYDIDLYVYFIYVYDKYSSDNSRFNVFFKQNLKDLFFSTDIESKFNKSKFKLHYSSACLCSITLDEDVNIDFFNYVISQLPDNLTGDLEKSIAVYITLCDILKYDSNFEIFKDYMNIIPYSEVDCNNNDVVCIQFSIIYYKILEKLGISANLAGDVNSHMFVNLNFGTMMIRADGNRYGYFNEDLTLSDLTNVKYGFMIDGFMIDGSKYSDIFYASYNRSRLENAIKTVYQKMGLKTNIRKKFDKLLDKIQKEEFDVFQEVLETDIDRRIEKLNILYSDCGCNIETMQYISMLINILFYDIAGERTENINLYKIVDGKAVLTKLLVIYDECMKPIYYFFRDGKYVKYSIDDVLDIILSEGWLFKNQMSIEALDISEEKMFLLLR